MNQSVHMVPQPKGQLIRFFREKAKHSLQDLADLAKLHVKTLRRAEQGQLTEYTLLCVSRALGIAPVNFFDPDELTIFLSGRFEEAERPHVEQSCANSGSEDSTDPEDLLERYDVIPKRYTDLKIEITFKQSESWHSIDVNTTEALGIESGASVNTGITIRTAKGKEKSYQLYASGGLAETMLDIAPEATVRALATTIYGIYPDRYMSDWRNFIYEEVTGLLLTRIISVGNVDETTPVDC